VPAETLKGISLRVRENGSVSIPGLSGCGKTTMLSIIGGPDRYTSGDLVILHMNRPDAGLTQYAADADCRNHPLPKCSEEGSGGRPEDGIMGKGASKWIPSRINS